MRGLLKKIVRRNYKGDKLEEIYINSELIISVTQNVFVDKKLWCIKMSNNDEIEIDAWDAKRLRVFP